MSRKQSGCSDSWTQPVRRIGPTRSTPSSRPARFAPTTRPPCSRRDRPARRRSRSSRQPPCRCHRQQPASFRQPNLGRSSRAVFGYSELGDREGLIQDDLHIDLAYAWELDPERLGGGEVGRFVPDRGWVTRPPWQIKDLRGGRWNRFTPRADQDGMICEDYLLIARLPDFLSSEAESRGQFLVNFGGARGAGTRAVELLFKDERLIAAVIEQLKAQYVGATGRIGGVPNAYQLLFRVIDIKHRPRSGSVPGKLELVDAIVLPDTDRALGPGSPSRDATLARSLQARQRGDGRPVRAVEPAGAAVCRRRFTRSPPGSSRFPAWTFSPAGSSTRTSCRWTNPASRRRWTSGLEHGRGRNSPA